MTAERSVTEFPDDDLPAPIVGRSRNVEAVLPATGRLGDEMPPPPRPPAAEPTNSQPPPRQPGKAATSRRKATKKEEPAAAAVVAARAVVDTVVTVPAALLAAVDDLELSRANALREAFGRFAQEVVKAHPPREDPPVPGMEIPPDRRVADPEDPFVRGRFRLRAAERELLDEWVGRSSLTRSGFVTELLHRLVEAAPVRA